MQTTNPDVPITPRQLEVLWEIANFQASQCYLPTIAEISSRLNVSRTTVFEHIAALRGKGLLSRSKGRARSLKLTDRASRLLENSRQTAVAGTGQTGALPLLGKVAAGVPVEAIENAEMLSLQDMFGSGDEMFLLEVSGDSMIDEGIYTGDYVVCKKASAAVNGQLVIAIVDNDNATLKRFYKESSHIRLEAANEAYQPIHSQNCRIEAVVTGLLKRL